MYVAYGQGRKPFNKGNFSFLIAFARQLEQALAERPDELEDTLGALANGLAYLTGEGSGLLPGDGELDDGSDADLGEASGLQDEMEADDAGSDDGRRQHGDARNLGGTIPGTRAVARNTQRQTLKTKGDVRDGKKQKKRVRR